MKENNIYTIIVPVKTSLKSINFYLVKDGHSLFLIDAGVNDENCWQALNKTLVQNRLTLKDITHILLTHHHLDHVGLVNRIVAEHPIPVYAHSLSFPRLRRDDAFMKMRIEFFSKLYEEMGCGEAGIDQVNYLKQAVIKNKSQKIDCDLYELTGDHFQSFDLVAFPGHAPDQIGFYQKEQKRLFSGDLLINHISSNALIEPDPFGERMKSLTEHADSYKKCLSLDVDILYSGHGEPITNYKEIIEKRLNGIERKAEKFLAIIASGKSTGSDIAKEYYKETYTRQFSLVMSEVIGHLDYLEMQGKVTKDFVGGVWRYSAI